MQIKPHSTYPQLIVKHYFKSLCWQNTGYFCPLSPLFLSTTSLILCHADGCNCQMVLCCTPLICGESERSGWERPAVEVGRVRSVHSSHALGRRQPFGDNCMVETLFIFMITLKQVSPPATRCLFFCPLSHNSSSSFHIQRAAGSSLCSKRVKHHYSCLQRTLVMFLLLLSSLKLTWEDKEFIAV